MTDERVKQIDKMVDGLRPILATQKKLGKPMMARAEEMLIEVWDEFKRLRGRI
jgi:hypothetical protein